jgi:hypothetical protein
MTASIDRQNFVDRKHEPLTSGHTPWGFQRNLQAQFSLARFVTGDRFVFTASPTSHTADRLANIIK